jgi:poly(A) polymerase
MMRNLSVERVWREIVKLLAAPNPLPSWRLIIQGGILQDIFPDTIDTERLARLMDTERKMDAAADALVRLAALLLGDTDAAALAARLKLSNRETETLISYVKLLPEMRGITDPVPLHRAMYQHGASACRAALLVVGSELPARDIGALYDEASTWEVPTFNLQGQDIVKLGIPQGPRVGEILKAVEEWWAGDDFHATRNECLAEAKRLITVSDR